MSETRSETREAEAEGAKGIGLFALLRELEQKAGDRPRIGKNTRVREALVRLGQDPFLAFPDMDLARADLKARPPMIRAQFLGFFGAFGALPLNWTEEIQRWFAAGDESFVAFTDVFATRFQELFYRTWADARPLTQFDHPTDDRFQTYLMALTGIGSPAFQGRDSVSDTVKMRLVPLAVGRVKSPVRLRQMLTEHFGGAIRFDVEELVPEWLEFEPDSLSRMGLQAATLGRDTHLGSRVRSIGEKMVLHVRVPTLEAYDRFLPGGPDHAHLRDITFWYLGQAYEIDVALWLPQPEVRPAVLGVSTRLGWMACMAPDSGNPDHMTRATRYRLAPEYEDYANLNVRAA